MAYEKSPIEHLYHSSKWQRTKDLVIQRANGRCERCGKMIIGRFAVHHTALASESNFYDTDILQLLCFNCHQHVTFVEDMRRTAKTEGNLFENESVDLIDFK